MYVTYGALYELTYQFPSWNYCLSIYSCTCPFILPLFYLCKPVFQSEVDELNVYLHTCQNVD